MLFMACFDRLHARLFVDFLRLPAGKGLTSWLSSVMSNCDVVTFPLVCWVRCAAGLYRFRILALFLTFTSIKMLFSIQISGQIFDHMFLSGLLKMHIKLFINFSFVTVYA